MLTFILNLDQLTKILKNNKSVEQWYQILSHYLPKYDINTPNRVASFIGQCMHESLNFTILQENLNYSAEALQRVWPKHFPTQELAIKYARQPEKIANRAYANRMGNGDETTGDGWRFCGRGLIQLTGKNNYKKFAESFDYELLDLSEYLLTHEGAVHSACWFWDVNKLNRFADNEDIKGMTKKINGGTIGLQDRIKHYNEVMQVLSM